MLWNAGHSNADRDSTKHHTLCGSHTLLLTCVVLLCAVQVFGEGVVNDAVSVVLLGAVAAAANAHGSAAAAGGSQHRLAGGIVANFIWWVLA